MKEPITPEGLESFREEFKKLYYDEKPYWVEQKKIAAEWGDRSENAEYIEAKNMIRNIDKRLRFVNNVIENAQVIDPKTLSNEQVRFGMSVVIESETESKIWTIVGTHESDPSNGKISYKSNVGNVLIGKSIGDEVEFNGIEYEVTKIFIKLSGEKRD